MMARCYRASHASYHRYGGRGIKVCKRWHDFVKFYEDNINRYSPGLQIDRTNNNGNYSLKNTRWVTSKVNSLNKEETLFMETPWGRMTVKEASEKSGIGYTTLLYRISRGVRVEDILQKPNLSRRFMIS